MSDAHNIHILIVDDEISIRSSLSEYLIDCDMSVQTVGSAEAGLKLLTREKFDLVIAEFRLPGQNGSQFILQAHRQQPDLKFIIHTGSTYFRIPPELDSIGLSAADIFTKPVFNLKDLYERIVTLLRAEKIA